MNFEELLRSFISRTKGIVENIKTKEATKISIIMPFFQILGYDVFNPTEFVPEYIAATGIKKGEKVDYAILQHGNPVILIEAISTTEKLENHDSQLFKHFAATKAKFAIITNGIEYKFYTDLDQPNKMDDIPFLELNLLKLKDNQLFQLKKFRKFNFDVNFIIDTASELRYRGQIRQVLMNEFQNPDEDFIKLIIHQGIFNGLKTKNVIKKFTPIVKKVISSYINELVNDKIQKALNAEEIKDKVEDDSDPLIITTEEELDSFSIIKAILSETIDLSRIYYKDTRSYFAILVDNKSNHWVCRLFYKENLKYMLIPNEDGSTSKYSLESLSDLYKYKEKLRERTLQTS